MINEDNIELWLFRYKEGMLNADEVAMVERAMAERSEWQDLADLYDPELRVPDYGDEVFPYKERLKKNKNTKFPLWNHFVAAACIAALAFTGIRAFFYDSRTTEYDTKKLAFIPSAVGYPPVLFTTHKATVHTPPKLVPTKSGTTLTECDNGRETPAYQEIPAHQETPIYRSEELIAYYDEEPEDKPNAILYEDFITYLDDDEQTEPENVTSSPLLSTARDRLNIIRLAYVEWQTAELKQKYENLNNN